MRLLPCRTSSCATAGLAALLGRSEAFPNGEPYVTGSFVNRYKCARCQRVSVLSAGEYNSLKELTLEDYNRIAKQYNAAALADLPTKDWVAVGLKKEHAEQMFRAGLHDPGHPDVAPPEGKA